MSNPARPVRRHSSGGRLTGERFPDAAPTIETGRALLYALGEALEAVGETARALAALLGIQTEAGGIPGRREAC